MCLRDSWASFESTELQNAYYLNAQLEEIQGNKMK